jgi:acyl-CoA synthetase (AMP-forming)/AMP-acid ligase II
MYPGTFAEITPEKAAVIVAETGQIVTYRQLNDESIQLARLFRTAGLKTGDRVAVLMDNDPRYLNVIWAARRTGMYNVPINWHLTLPEMAYVIENSGAKALITNSACGGMAMELLKSLPNLFVTLALDAAVEGFDDYDEAIGAHSADPLEGETEGDDIIYTSGTTGRPKGGMRPLKGTHPGTDMDPMGRVLSDMFGFDEDTRYLMPGAPLYHAAPLRFTMVITRSGGTNVVMKNFDAEAALAAIETHQIGHSQWVPTMFVRLLRLDSEVRRSYDLSSHIAALHAAAPCPAWAKEQMIDWWGPILLEYYGASEGGGVTMISSQEWQKHRGSVGRPIVGKLHIVDNKGRECPTGETGVVYAENALPIEYLGDTEKTAGVRTTEGWETVGDMGYLDCDGYLYLTDRKNNMIISGGVNIYPQEAEDALSQHPKVADIAVIGIPNDEFGEEVKGVVQLVDPSDASEETSEELLDYCRQKLAHYKCPRTIDFIDELPRAPSGKLYKRRIQDPFWVGHASRVV